MTAADALTRFTELHTAEWRWRVEQFGEQTVSGHAASGHGPVDDRLPDVGEEAQQERLRYWDAVLARLAGIPVEELPAAARVDLAVYRQQLTVLAEQQRLRMYQRPANADSAFWTDLSARCGRPLDSAEDARRLLRQLRDVPRYFAQHTENMRDGLRRGFGPPGITMRGREEPIRAVAEAASPREVAYFAPFAELPQHVPAEVRHALRREATEVIADAVVPAYRDLLAFVTGEYLPRLPERIAACDGPDGEAFYLAQLREFTTTDLGPKEIFDLGMAEVVAIREEMEQVAAEVGFAGDVRGLLEFMRTDRQFYATTPRQLLHHAAWVAKKFDGCVHRFFGRVPRGRFGIVEPPAEVAPYFTFGRGGIDRYTLNTYNLPARPLYSLPALTLHESAPGHCFQMAFAFEQTGHPEFRRQVYISAYGEGWALYCERLGVEMGIYETPFEVMGMLSFQMWRAARLVVDPGMHAFGWTREQAQDFMRENTAIAEHEIVTEVDRYIAWPGQATAYHLGQLKILELRRLAERELGGRFDLRSFHDAVLALGSVPLTVLEQELTAFVAAGGRSPFEQEETAHA